MNLTSKITALRNESRDLTLKDRAELACRSAKQLAKAGEYESAYEALSEFGLSVPKHPRFKGLRNARRQSFSSESAP